MIKPKYDTSTKPYEIQCISYTFYKYGRKLIFPAEWRHHKYYNTYEQALDAIRDFRHFSLDRAYRDYPSTDSESKYPHITPSINITRYRIVKRDI